MAAPASPTLLDIAGLTVRFPTDRGPFIAVRGLDLADCRRRDPAVVGESGSGKSVTALAIMRLVDYGGRRIVAGASVSATARAPSAIWRA